VHAAGRVAHFKVGASSARPGGDMPGVMGAPEGAAGAVAEEAAPLLLAA